MSNNEYAELVEQAEKAVTNVKDADLRRVAFEKVLERLLHGPQRVHSEQSSGRKVSAKQKPAAPSSGKRVKSTGPKAYLREMVDDGFFDKPKTITEAKGPRVRNLVDHSIAARG